jgi:sulfur-oxidizing protein SoxY
MPTRRTTLALALGAAALPLLHGPAQAVTFDEAVAAYTGGAPVTEGSVTLTLPETAENGGAVPLAVAAPGAVEIRIFAPRNPLPVVATFRFGPGAGAPRAATRIRLAETQEVLAIAKMADGTLIQARASVTVAIGGCEA